MEAILLNKITKLAVKAERPLIIIENPSRSSTSKFGFYHYIASIGEAYVGFDGYSVDDLVELYADFKAQLEVENAKNSQP